MKSAMLFERLIEDKKVKCYLCHHNCRISDGKFGICNVRQNLDGDLYTLAGRLKYRLKGHEQCVLQKHVSGAAAFGA